VRRSSVLLSVLAIVIGYVAPARGSPDLTPEIYGVELQTHQSVTTGEVQEGCAGSTTDRTLLRFGVYSHNVGPDPLVIGDPGCPDCSVQPGAACANAEFQCSLSGQPRPVFLSSARYELFDPAGHVVAVGAKRNYCFNDDECDPGSVATFTDCSHQGVTSGCADDYEPELPCQYIDVTNVPDVTTRAFRLRVTIDPLNLLPDANVANNVIEVAIPGCGDGILQAGEDCDPGPAGTAECCDAQCHLRPAGTECRAAIDPCDAAELCDGQRPSCPPDVRLPDGATCGAGTVSCLTPRCQAGACVDTLAPGTCTVDSTCAVGGSSNPADPCLVCDPVRDTSAWSPNVAADTVGMRCQVDRLTEAVAEAGCTSAAARALRNPLHHLSHIVATTGTANPNRFVRRARRPANRLASGLQGPARRGGCSVDPATAALQVFLGQLDALAGGT